MLRQNKGYWQGTLGGLKSDSKYLGATIYTETNQIGKKIQAMRHLFLSVDAIKVEKNRKNGGYIYTFTQQTDNELETYEQLDLHKVVSS